jgi:hypothetical protein
MRNVTSFAKIFILLVGVSCVSKPSRPDSSLCLANSDGWFCTNSGGDYREQESNLICTDLSGYAALERYVDQIELRLKKLERRCGKTR